MLHRHYDNDENEIFFHHETILFTVGRVVFLSQTLKNFYEDIIYREFKK